MKGILGSAWRIIFYSQTSRVRALSRTYRLPSTLKDLNGNNLTSPLQLTFSKKPTNTHRPHLQLRVGRRKHDKHHKHQQCTPSPPSPSSPPRPSSHHPTTKNITSRPHTTSAPQVSMSQVSTGELVEEKVGVRLGGGRKSEVGSRS